MKYKFTALTLLPAALSAQVLLTDDFNGPLLDTSKWQTSLPNGSSSVSQTGGVVTSTARGVLGTVDSFIGPYSITGTFTMLNDLEHFNISLRTDLSASDYGERPGILVQFVNDGDGVALGRYTNSSSSESLAPSVPYAFTTGASYSFIVTDDGLNITLSIDNVLLISGSSTYSTGNHIGFYSREFPSTSTQIDSLTISTIPEPSTFGLLLGFGVMGYVAVKRKK